ncbi:alpha-isopropylmalate synthase regulatory domain-containing protein [Rhodococcus sp. NPDC003318]|uniref:alpha-isopropylmalate synthase regulatory domain-containing protein n=1 Tax=Rhodococcus sp. NPDC003318 TaxID=3364503 RepID=UPI003699E937
MTAPQMWKLLNDSYSHRGSLLRWAVDHVEGGDRLRFAATVGDTRVDGDATASGPVDALTLALSTPGAEVEVLSLTQQSIGAGRDAEAATFAHCRVGDRAAWGVGLDRSVTASTLRAVLAAASRVPTQVTEVTDRCGKVSPNGTVEPGRS